MIQQIASIFSRHNAHHIVSELFDHVYDYEAAVLYENFEDRNIYDINSLRQYVTIILKETNSCDQTPDVSDEMIHELRCLLLK